MENLDLVFKTISLEQALLVSGALSQVELVTYILDRKVRVKLLKALENTSDYVLFTKNEGQSASHYDGHIYCA